MERPFLTARWEHLILLNFECPRELLEPRVPVGTTLELWDGAALVSLVAFMFRDARVRGIAIPGHRTFEEVNLRFYVRRETRSERRRGVVFIRELVPRPAIAAVARWLYNEPYRTASMGHYIDLDPVRGGVVQYGWLTGGDSFDVLAEAEGQAREPDGGSEAEFVTEHYWGYTKQRDGGTLEYRVEHARWSVREIGDAGMSGSWRALYGPELGAVIERGPRSSFLALGGPVAVHRGVRIDPEGG